jgi:hypothetical protein
MQPAVLQASAIAVANGIDLAPQLVELIVLR